MTTTSETKVFLLPDLGEGLTEAELVNWLVAVGDEIHVDQPIAEVETAKSMVEVPSPFAGIVAELHGEPGQTLDVGKPLISVAPLGGASETGTGEVLGTVAAEAPMTESVETTVEEIAHAKAASTTAAETYRTEDQAGSGNVLIGYGTSAGGEAKRTRPRRTSSGSVIGLAESTETVGAPTSRTRAPGKLSTVISPLVRKMARDNGVSLDQIEGSGESGLIMRRDVEAAISHAPRVAEVAALVGGDVADGTKEPELVPARAGAQDARTGLPVSSRTPIRGVRKAIAANMARSRSEIPEATVWMDVDATALLEIRAELKKRDQNPMPGILAFIARFVTAGLRKFPELNTRVETGDDGGQDIVVFDGVNLGFAAQTDRGLVVPSIRNADRLTARELDGEIRRLTAIAREGKAGPSELSRGTFTLNNYGVFGVDGSAAIINYPEVAILGIGRIIDKPWVVDGQLAVRKVTELTLTFDHRVCDGATAAGFLKYVADGIERPGGMLADL
jgi:pyruvate dehydrogenase E2 component (dihydrolipoamide acetyltransferase)